MSVCLCDGNRHGGLKSRHRLPPAHSSLGLHCHSLGPSLWSPQDRGGESNIPIGHRVICVHIRLDSDSPLLTPTPPPGRQYTAVHEREQARLLDSGRSRVVVVWEGFDREECRGGGVATAGAPSGSHLPLPSPRRWVVPVGVMPEQQQVSSGVVPWVIVCPACRCWSGEEHSSGNAGTGDASSIRTAPADHGVLGHLD